MSENNTPFFDEHGSSNFDESLKNAMEETEFLVQHLEPQVRELNRNYREVLGAHPNSPDGNWLFLSRNDNGDYCFAFYSLSVDRATLHTARVGDSAAILEEYGDEFGIDSSDYNDVGAQVIGEVASLSHIPSTHVHVERRS
jgi:hypothetical protein